MRAKQRGGGWGDDWAGREKKSNTSFASAKVLKHMFFVGGKPDAWMKMYIELA